MLICYVQVKAFKYLFSINKPELYSRVEPKQEIDAIIQSKHFSHLHIILITNQLTN